MWCRTVAYLYFGGAGGEESACQGRDTEHRLIPWVQVSSWKRKCIPPQVFLPRGSVERRAWQATARWSQSPGTAEHTHMPSLPPSHICLQIHLLLIHCYLTLSISRWLLQLVSKHTSPLCHNLGGDTTRVQITDKVHSRRVWLELRHRRGRSAGSGQLRLRSKTPNVGCCEPVRLGARSEAAWLSFLLTDFPQTAQDEISPGLQVVRSLFALDTLLLQRTGV